MVSAHLCQFDMDCINQNEIQIKIMMSHYKAKFRIRVKNSIFQAVFSSGKVKKRNSTDYTKKYVKSKIKWQVKLLFN